MSLLRSAGRALETLGKKETEDGDAAAAITDENGVDIFQESMNDFIRSLRRVGVGMKRQILGLEEAGIIGLRKDDAADWQQPRLEPDGEGKIGGFDVGWLNSRSYQVEKQMEPEEWGKIESFLQETLDKKLNVHSNADTNGN